MHDPLLAVLRAGGEYGRIGRYEEARRVFSLLQQATSLLNEHYLNARALANIGACDLALHQYRPALRVFLEARKRAQEGGDYSAVAALDANIASLYTDLGELDAAADWMKGTLDQLTKKDRADHLPIMLLHMGTVRAGQHRLDEAIPYFRQGLEAAASKGDLSVYSNGCNRLGVELLRANRPQEAETALLEAYRVKKLNKMPLGASLRNLGRLRLEQNRLDEASALLDRAIEQPLGKTVPSWDAYHYRGRVRLEQGRLREAMEDLRIATRLGRAWRWSATSDDTGRMGAEFWLSDVHSAFIDAGNRLYLQTHDPHLIEETFEAAEENRAASLRALIGEKRDAGEFPPEYWQAVSRLQKAEMAALRTPGPAAEASARAARAEVMRLEEPRPQQADPQALPLLERMRASLGRDAALLSFHLGPNASWLWALDRNGLAAYQLPARRELEEMAAAVRDAIRDGGSGAGSEALYQTLFGQLDRRLLGAHKWLLALDGVLFDVPFAALPERNSQSAGYMAEHRVVEVVPGAAVWLEAAAKPALPRDGMFLGVGDPIYNFADPRLEPHQRPAKNITFFSPWTLMAAPKSADPFRVMPRLVASGVELQSCARVWGGNHILLSGRSATRAAIQAELNRNPEVAHFATHVVESADGRREGLIALSLTRNGETELLAPFEISRWKTQTRVVVLSGCHSAAGAALPGAGLLGLTRAWLAAGARTVVGSRWSTPDEDGALFSAFYRQLRQRPADGVAAALREAQLEMIHSRDWRANPRYWGAYFAVGQE